MRAFSRCSASSRLRIASAIDAKRGETGDGSAERDVMYRLLTASWLVGLGGHVVSATEAWSWAWNVSSPLVVGAPDGTGPADPASNPGEVYVFSGASLPTGAASEMDARTMIESTTADGFGLALLSTDVDADGTDDLLVAAPLYDGTYGRVSLFLVP